MPDGILCDGGVLQCTIYADQPHSVLCFGAGGLDTRYVFGALNILANWHYFTLPSLLVWGRTVQCYR